MFDLLDKKTIIYWKRHHFWIARRTILFESLKSKQTPNFARPLLAYDDPLKSMCPVRFALFNLSFSFSSKVSINKGIVRRMFVFTCITGHLLYLPVRITRSTVWGTDDNLTHSALRQTGVKSTIKVGQATLGLTFFRQLFPINVSCRPVR